MSCDHNIKNVIANFNFRGQLSSIAQLSLNSYRLVYMQGEIEKEYLLEKISPAQEEDSKVMTENRQKVCAHLAQSYLQEYENPYRHVPEMVETQDHCYLYTAKDQYIWRAFSLIPDTCTYQEPMEEGHYFELGRVYGDFYRRMVLFPTDEFCETLPDYNNALKHIENFYASIKANKAGRKEEVLEETKFLLQHQDIMRSIMRRIARNEIPLRVTLNNSKTKEVIFDENTGHTLGLMGFDNLHLGAVLSDFGELARNLCSTKEECETDPTKITFDLRHYCLFIEGFLSKVNGVLTREEVLLLPLGIRVATTEVAMRSLTAYLNGEADENTLLFVQSQIALLKDIETKKTKMDMFLLNVLHRS